MIMPNMATMLAFVLTDANILFPQLHESLVQGVSNRSTGLPLMATPAPTI